jgi:hypothetical protein
MFDRLFETIQLERCGCSWNDIAKDKFVLVLKHHTVKMYVGVEK